MKKHFVLLLALVATLMMASCKKEKVNYYVKYEAIGSYYGGLMKINVNTENGIQSFTTSSKTYSETFGPVSKGFAASISIIYSTNLNTYIYVSRGEEPFVLKATGTSAAEYVIDF